MEQIIAKLLQEFENGKMSRRQLIQSLTMAASVAAAAAPASGAENKGFQAVTVNHISYQVADYAKTRDFYSDLLGMKASHDDGKQCYMSFGDTFLLPRKARQGVTAPRVDHSAYTIETWAKNQVQAALRR